MLVSALRVLPFGWGQFCANSIISGGCLRGVLASAVHSFAPTPNYSGSLGKAPSGNHGRPYFPEQAGPDPFLGYCTRRMVRHTDDS